MNAHLFLLIYMVLFLNPHKHNQNVFVIKLTTMTNPLT